MEDTVRKDAPDTCYTYQQIITKDQPDGTCMLEKWESLTTRVEETQMAIKLHRELTALRTEFKSAHDRLFSYEITLEQPHVLDERINRITAELAALRDRKAAMLSLNVSTHRLITDHGNSASLIFTALKDGVADLYRVWDETFQKGNQQLCALQAVQQFSIRLAELQCALRRDKDTLAVLDVALQAGATSEVASSVRHVARLLSEKQDISCQNGTVLKDSSTEEVSSGVATKFGDSSPISLTQEGGSLSDSGISDSGSEQELSERERRLAALRRLTRTLESQLAPGSEALSELWKRVEDAETELRDLQKHCRELIVRTAASVEARAAKRTSSQVHHFVDKRKKATSTEMKGGAKRIVAIAAKSGATDGGNPDNEPVLPQSWVWRILRTALPFQLALVALFCAACLLEPHCCEATNTLNLSLTPQLRYVRGPPPV
ncbi:Klarsicht protein [Anthophora plagiata]